MVKDPIVTVVIPVYNEEELISNSIQSLLDQSYKPIEIIVIDDGSTDKTVEKVKQFSQVRLIQQEHGGTGKAWNLGAKEAKGKIMVLFAGDMQAPKDFIEQLARPIINKEAKGTLHDVEYILNQDNIWARCWSARWGLHDGKYVSFTSNTPSGWAPNFEAILIDEYVKRGGFNPKRGYADDQSIGEKNPLKFKIIKDCHLYHNYPSSWKDTFFQSRWIGGSFLFKNIWKKGLIALIGLGIYFTLTLNSSITGAVIGSTNNTPLLSLSNSLLLLLALIILAILIQSAKIALKVKDYQVFLVYPFFLTTKIFGNIVGYSRKLLFGKYTK
ncbi:MAG: glycosyltransferase family 2 protein [Nanoarchaeota archaeon]